MKSLFLALVISFLSFGFSMGQEIILKLTPNGSKTVKANYQFKQVTDSRTQKSVGLVYDSQRNKHPASFDGKLGEQALALYSSGINPSSNSSHEILVKIYNLDQNEIYQADQRGYKGEIQLSLGFFLMGKKEPVHLVDFNGKAQYGRPTSQMYNVGISIQKMFENSQEYFDAWFNTQSQNNRAFVKKVRLNILDPKRKSNKDTVFYDPERPLTWDDFTGFVTPRSPYNATIFSSLSIAGNAAIVDGEIVQTIDIKVYMIPDQSWVKNANAYANNHEQRHFDLTRIAADRMIARLNSTELDPDLFEATLNDIYLDAYREMNHLQDLYDGQTDNGINKEMQATWNQVISQALRGNWEKLDLILAKEK